MWTDLRVLEAPLPRSNQGLWGEGDRGPGCLTAAPVQSQWYNQAQLLNLYSNLLLLKYQEKTGKARSALFTPQKTYIKLSFSCVKALETGPNYKLNTGILHLFSATLRAQDLIINGS